MAKIKMYTTNWCSDCKRTKAWLDDKGINYEEIEVKKIAETPEGKRLYSMGISKVPTVVLTFPDGSGQVLIEPSDEELEKVFKLGI